MCVWEGGKQRAAHSCLRDFFFPFPATPTTISQLATPSTNKSPCHARRQPPAIIPTTPMLASSHAHESHKIIHPQRPFKPRPNLSYPTSTTAPAILLLRPRRRLQSRQPHPRHAQLTAPIAPTPPPAPRHAYFYLPCFKKHYFKPAPPHGRDYVYLIIISGEALIKSMIKRWYKTKHQKGSQAGL